MEWTQEKLAAKSPEQRYRLYLNARKQAASGSEDAAELVATLEASDLQIFPKGGLANDDPILIEIRQIVYSDAAEAAIREAVADGIPPLGKVDPLIAGQMGGRYTADNTGTATAGDFVVQRTRTMGFTDTGKQRKLPGSCVAKTGRFFTAA